VEQVGSDVVVVDDDDDDNGDDDYDNDEFQNGNCSFCMLLLSKQKTNPARGLSFHHPSPTANTRDKAPETRTLPVRS
jgi:hypothetical protein